jgi:hypothetical protein
MKNKKTAWILLPVVLGIWGMIGWKIYEATHDAGDHSSGNESDVIAALDSLPVSDTYTLILNYRDPFLGNIPEPRIQKEKPAQHNSQKVAAVITQPASELPVLRYYGLVKESNSGKTVGFLKVNGETHFVKTGDEVSVLKVLALSVDSAVVSVGKEKIVVKK